MRRALPAIIVVLAVLTVIAIAGIDAWRTATVQGWLEDGYRRLAWDAFWYRFDRSAPIALGVLAVGLLGWVIVRRMTPSRRDLAIPLGVIGLTLVGRAVPLAFDAVRPHRPNVLLISIDTLRADRVGAYGYARPTTPAIDARLATGGVVFENAWSQSPKTTPSHMTMLTSLYPAVHGVVMWEGEGAAASLNPRVHTLAEMLANAGYATAAFTAGGHMHRDRGFVQGFEVYKHGTQLRRTLEYLRAPRRRPFFLFFHTYEVHDPYLPPPAAAQAFATDPVPAIAETVERIRSGVGGWLRGHKTFWAAVDARDPRHVRYVSDLYDAGIRRMDDTTVPVLLDALDELGLTAETLVVFTADHGEAFQEHGRFLHDDLHAETLRVPLVLRFPGRLLAGRRVREPVGLVDLLPTILDLLSIPVPAQAQGTSLAALARGTENASGPQAVLAEYSTAGRTFESIRQSGTTLIRDNEGVALFDDTVDPGETRNLAADAAERVTVLRRELDRWHHANVRLAAQLGPRAGDVAAPSPDTVKQLRALGYVE